MTPAAVMRGRVAVGAATVLVMAAAPLVVSAYSLQILSTLGIAIILALGLNILMGYAGQVSLANAAFFGVGTYGVAVLGNGTGLTWWLAVPIVAAATAVIGLAVGLPALRVSSHYLALATLAFVWTVQVVLVNWVSVTGGSPGLATSRAGMGLGVFQRDWAYYLLILGVTTAMLALAMGIVRSKIGRAFTAIRDNENAAEIMGISLAQYKTMAFGINAFYCAVAGGLQAGLVRFLDPYEFGLWPSIWHLLYIVVGGLGTITGAILGPVVLVALPEALRTFAEYRELIFAIVLLVTLIYLPEGLAGLVRPLAPARRTAAQAPAQVRLTTAHPRAARGSKALVVDGIRLSFGGVHALQSASLTVTEGQIHALIGPNGAGKTTFLNVLCRVYAPDAGTMMFRGHPLLKLKPHQLAPLGIVRTFQNIRLFGRMTALDNVLVGAHAQIRHGLLGAALRLPRARAEAAAQRARALMLLSYVGLHEAWNVRADALAFGQQRRLELARALAADPALLLLDEPASGLDKTEVMELVSVIRTIRRDLGVSILLIEHDMDFVMGLADRITVLDHGAVIAEGPPSAIQADRRVIEAYLGQDHVRVDA